MTTNVLQSLFALSGKPTALHIGVGVWLATVCNLPLWIALGKIVDTSSLGGTAFIFAFCVAIAAANTALLSLFAFGPWRRLVLSAFIVIAALSSHFMLTYGVVIDTGMATNTIQTDIKEVQDLLNLRLFVTVLLLAGPPLWWIWRTKTSSRKFGQVLVWHIGTVIGSMMLVVSITFMAFQPLASTMRDHTKIRYLINPFNSLYAFGKSIKGSQSLSASELLPVGQDARVSVADQRNEDPVLFLIVGETARAASFPAYGYERPTTPRLSGRDDIFYAANAWSCGTSTAESLPCMFSPLGRTEFLSRSQDTENLLEVLQRAGLAVLWLDNQSGCKGICKRVPTAVPSASPEHSSCAQLETCQDTIMLSGIAERIKSLPAESRKRGTVVVLHQMGSHGPAYYRRSSPERKVFMPECTSSALQSCKQGEVKNAYDNSIVETDYFLSQSIQWLSDNSGSSATAMLYVSDHGESLGEGNLYLHGLPYALAPDEQKKIPWIFWMSAPMTTQLGISPKCLQKEMKEKSISHDNYFHTVLGVMGVQTSIYNPTFDVLSSCRR
ncbi:phosphoethanolamine--lipid A transferase [Diaphorobacter aerolatus]|uniref:Phosphoethanolamine--lipid A transferase n=2 Tax=Diaphorobacter aerolatus TaxID=1288495 RepID=A0A7H0GPH2_9BURK|nr:phosphoethanolamine--lipid A transferase [Diaphorobacter aerolatus]